MRYTLKRRVFAGPDFIEISQHEFNRWKCTQSELLSVLNIEATFDLLLENYAEFERDFLAINHRLSLFQEHGEPLGPYREMNRRMVNLLSSARLYLDEVPQDLHAIYPKNPTNPTHAATFKQRCSTHYDLSLAYRVMEALRNYAQHSGFPVRAMTHSFHHEEKNPGFLHRMTLHLQTWPGQTLLVKWRRFISSAMRVHSTSGMTLVSLVFKRRIQDRFSARFGLHQQSQDR